MIKKILLKHNQDSAVYIPHGVVIVIMSNKFNSHVIFPETVKKIKMGWNFNKLVLLPDCLRSFEMGWNFNKPVLLPDSLHYLKIGRNFTQEFIMPPSLVALDIFCCSSKKYDDINFLKLFGLPNTLRKIVAGKNILQHLYNIPESINNILIPGLSSQLQFYGYKTSKIGFSTLIMNHDIKPWQ